MSLGVKNRLRFTSDLAAVFFFLILFDELLSQQILSTSSKKNEMRVPLFSFISKD